MHQLRRPSHIDVTRTGGAVLGGAVLTKADHSPSGFAAERAGIHQGQAKSYEARQAHEYAK